VFLKDIFYKLPEPVMPKYLKTEKQRSNVEEKVFDNIKSSINHVSLWLEEGAGFYIWNMAAYPTADNSNLVLIVQYGSGLDGFELKSDRTLNYNIETGELSEIERPIDPITADELIDESLFESPKLAAKAKAFFNKNKTPVNYGDFDREGFIVRANLLGYDDEDYYGMQNSLQSSRKWNGARFVKGERKRLNE
jgi:hypothetical protein